MAEQQPREKPPFSRRMANRIDPAVTNDVSQLVQLTKGIVSEYIGMLRRGFNHRPQYRDDDFDDPTYYEETNRENDRNAPDQRF